MAHDVFISHSAEDKNVADVACAALEEEGIRCWIAPRDIFPGATWSGAIIDAIMESRIMVFIFSASSNNSPHVLRELECAVSAGVCIMPFRIEDVLPSKSIQYFISSSHWLDASPRPTEEHYAILIKTVKRFLAEGVESDNVELTEAGLTEPGSNTRRTPRGTGILAPTPTAQTTTENEYEKEMDVVNDLLASKQWVACVRGCGALFAKGLRQLLRELLDATGGADIRDRITAAEKRIGGSPSTWERFGLAELVSLFAEADVFSEIRRQLTSNLQKVRCINWNLVAVWYDTSTQTADLMELDEDDAMQMAYWLKIFLYDCELAGKPPAVPPVHKEARSFTECPCCSEPLKNTWNYCPQCGAGLRVTCEVCHRALAHDFKICPYCETVVQRRGVAVTDEVRKAREEFRILCVGAYLDGVVNIRERRLLENKRLELGLSTEEAERIKRDCAPDNVIDYTGLVEGVLVDGVITDAEHAFLQKRAKEMKLDEWVAGQIEKVELAARKEAPGSS